MTGVLAGLAVLALLAGAGAAGDLAQGLLCLLPAVLLLVALAFGYAPGEASLERLRARRRRRARPGRLLVLTPRSAPRACAGGGLLLALSLATRPPPYAAPATA